MSYEIFYNKQFIKVDDNRVIPMVEMGSNNCYEASGGNARRARDWHNSTAFNKDCNVITTNADLLAEIEKWQADKFKGQYVSEGEEPSTEAEFNKRFGYHTLLAMYGKHTTTTSYGMFLGFFKAGIANAKTIEELAEKGIIFYLTVLNYCEDKATEKGLEIKDRVAFTSTEQMIAAIAEYEDYYRGTGVGYYISTRTGYAIESMQRQDRRAKKAALPKKEPIEVSEYYALKCLTTTGYFIKQSRRKYRYAFTPSGGKKFASEKEAIRYHKRMKNNGLFAVEKIAEKTTIFA
jgi:hypothetical protein